MSIEFKREERYIVFKLSDLGNSLKGDEIRRLAREYAEHRQQLRKPPLEGVFVEKDWPEYEPTWRAIEARDTGAQPTPSVPKGWLRAIDEAMAVTHLGVADASDSYEAAKDKLNRLIGWHTDVAIDPAVNGGYRLVPDALIHRAIETIGRFCSDEGWGQDDMDTLDALIAAAPEAKP